MVLKSKDEPTVDLKQDLHGLKILTDNRASVPIDISKLKTKTIPPATFIPNMPNKMVTGGVQLPDDMKDIISMQVKPIDSATHPPMPYKHPRNLINNYAEPHNMQPPTLLPHIPGHLDTQTDPWKPGAIFKTPGINRYYDDWNTLCGRMGYRTVSYKYHDYKIKGQLKQFMEYNSQKHSNHPAENKCFNVTKRWPVVLSSWSPSEVQKPWISSPTYTSRSDMTAKGRKKKRKKSERENPEVKYRRTAGGSILHFLQRCQTDHVYSQPRKNWTAKHDAKPFSVI